MGGPNSDVEEVKGNFVRLRSGLAPPISRGIAQRKKGRKVKYQADKSVVFGRTECGKVRRTVGLSVAAHLHSEPLVSGPSAAEALC